MLVVAKFELNAGTRKNFKLARARASAEEDETAREGMMNSGSKNSSEHRKLTQVEINGAARKMNDRRRHVFDLIFLRKSGSPLSHAVELTYVLFACMRACAMFSISASRSTQNVFHRGVPCVCV